MKFIHKCFHQYIIKIITVYRFTWQIRILRVNIYQKVIIWIFFFIFFFSFFFMQNDGGVKSKLKLHRLKEWAKYMMKFHQYIIKIITVYKIFWRIRILRVNMYQKVMIYFFFCFFFSWKMMRFEFDREKDREIGKYTWWNLINI